MLASALTELHLGNLAAIERTGSVCSLVGVIFIVITFLVFPDFQKPITRLIFYASFGNVFTCLGTMIARAAISGTLVTHPTLCRTQAFLIQMFMPADALWGFAMALNLYLTFYHQFTASQLYRIEKYYIALCYGIPFTVAFCLLWIATNERGLVYGNATLWCWIASDWDHYRMYLFYGPVWFFCVLTIFIYIRLLYTVLMNQLNLSAHTRGADPSIDPGVTTGTRTNTTSFQSEPASSIPLQDMSGAGNTQHDNTQHDHTQHRAPGFFIRAYQSQISGGTVLPAYPPGTMPSSSRQKYRTSVIQGPDHISTHNFQHAPPPPPRGQPLGVSQRHNTAAAEAALRIMGAVALFFFVIMLVTWVPSSANRLYSVMNPKQVNLILEYLAACVLPMQGVWNCVIYCIINRKACKKLVKVLFQRRQLPVINLGYSLRSAFSETPGIFIRTPSSRNGAIPAINPRTAMPPTTNSRPISQLYPPGLYNLEDESEVFLWSARASTSRPESSRPTTGQTSTRTNLDPRFDLDA